MNFKLRIIEISRDVGGRKGTVYELHGHRNKVTCMSYLATSKRLMSCGEDGNLILWNMAVEREEVNGARSFRCALLFPLHVIWFIRVWFKRVFLPSTGFCGKIRVSSTGFERRKGLEKML